MRSIAIIFWDLTIAGGSMRQALQLAINLQKQGHNVEIISAFFNQKTCYPELNKQIPIYSACGEAATRHQLLATDNIIIKIFKHILNIYTQKRVLKKVENLIRKRDKINNFQIINYHDYPVQELSSKFSNKRQFWMMNDLPSSLDAFVRKTTKDFKAFSFLLPLLIKNEKSKIKYIDRIITLDNRNKFLVKEFYHRDSTVIRSGIDLEKGTTSFKKKSEAILNILLVGIFFPHRRFEDFIEAYRKLPSEIQEKTRVEIVGAYNFDNGYYQYILGLIKKYKLRKKITLSGAVSENILTEKYHTADIFVFPNHNQTWGLSVFEAMLAGCTCIVSSGCGASEVLTDGENSLIFETLNTNHLTEKLLFSIENKNLRRSVGFKAQRFVLDNLSWDKYASAMFRVFNHH